MQESRLETEIAEAKKETLKPTASVLKQIVFKKLSETDFVSASIAKDVRLAFWALLEGNGIDPNGVVKRELSYDERSPNKDKAVFLSLRFKGAIVCHKDVLNALEELGFEPAYDKDPYAYDPDSPLYRMPPIIEGPPPEKHVPDYTPKPPQKGIRGWIHRRLFYP